MAPASGLDPRKERKTRRNSEFSPTDLHAGVVQGENSVRGFEKETIKRKETTAKPPRGAKMRERRDSSAGTRSTANVLHFCDAKRSLGVPAESIFGGA